MCISFPYGIQNRGGGTRLGRYLRERPARASRWAGLFAICLGPVLPYAAPSADRSWSALVLLAGISAPILAHLMERLPEHCRVSPPDYPRHASIGAALIAGALFVGLDVVWLGPVSAWLGAGTFALAWRLAAAPVARAIAWCRGRPPIAARALVTALGLGAAVPLVLATAASLGPGLAATVLGLGGAALGVGILSVLTGSGFATRF
jgi:hypothetical protein